MFVRFGESAAQAVNLRRGSRYQDSTSTLDVVSRRGIIMRQRTIGGLIIIAAVVGFGAFGARALQSTPPAVAQSNVAVEAISAPVVEQFKIVPALAEGSDSSFFVGTGDGGNGVYIQ